MKYIIMSLAILVSAPSFAHDDEKNNGHIHAITYKVPEHQLEDAKLLSAAIGSISEPVTKCVKSGKEYQKCLCDNVDKINSVKKIFKKLLQKYPEWSGERIVLYYETSTPEFPIYSHNLSIGGIKKHLLDKDHCK